MTGIHVGWHFFLCQQFTIIKDNKSNGERLEGDRGKGFKYMLFYTHNIFFTGQFSKKYIIEWDIHVNSNLFLFTEIHICMKKLTYSICKKICMFYSDISIWLNYIGR